MNENGMTDKILSNAQEDIRHLLQDDEMTITDKKILEVLGFVLAFVISDRMIERKKRDWYFRIIIGTAISGLVMLAVNAIWFWIVNNYVVRALQSP